MSGANTGSASENATSRGNSTDLQNVELEEMAAEQKPKLPIEEDIMQLARLGEIKSIQSLLEEGKFDATFTDEQGITPLHWAAINNHYALCHFLIQSGANINAKGGDAEATPVLWAAKRCHYYIVNLLLQNGADPLLTDNGGFNLLHSATLDGNVYQLVLLLHQDIPIDIPDEQGHTSLMWAAYKGYPACVDLFLRWGSNVHSTDDQGFTALHWALVKGSQGCIQKLVEFGSDRFAENNEGKTPRITAEEMDTTKQWHKALSECGYGIDGMPIFFPLSAYVKDKRTFLAWFFFLWPFVMLYVALKIMSSMVIYLAVPITFFISWMLQYTAQQAIRWAPPDIKHIHHTPFLSGVFAGSLFWVGVAWVVAIFPWTFQTNPFLNIIFVGFFSICTYFYASTMLQDPGYVSKPGSRTSQKAIIDELIELQKFDEHNFCIHCMIRKPLRSKHCKRCNRCVAKLDHHCPWVDNCVAVNNHRHFLFFIFTMQLGMLAFLRLLLHYLDNIPTPKDTECYILNETICGIFNKDPFTLILSLWVALQLIWVTMLIVVQLVQIARGLTTIEAMHGHTHSNPTGEAVTSFITTGSTSIEGGQVSTGGGWPTAPSEGQTPRNHRHVGFFEQWKRLLGLDTFIATALHGSNARQVQARQQQNPFTRGIFTNCRDFWCDPAPLFRKRDHGMATFDGQRVDYSRLYKVPAKMRRTRGGEEGNYLAVDTDDTV